MDFLAKLFEHNNWANLQVVRACATLSAKQLDEKPLTTSTWSIRDALIHLVESQRGYLLLLTVPPEERKHPTLEFSDLEESVIKSGEVLLALTHDGAGQNLSDQIRSMDGYVIEPWVVMVQVIHHGNDHRRQISGMLKALGADPPDIAGWAFGEVEDAVIPPSG